MPVRRVERLHTLTSRAVTFSNCLRYLLVRLADLVDEKTDCIHLGPVELEALKGMSFLERLSLSGVTKLTDKALRGVSRRHGIDNPVVKYFLTVVIATGLRPLFVDWSWFVCCRCCMMIAGYPLVRMYRRHCLHVNKRVLLWLVLIRWIAIDEFAVRCVAINSDPSNK